MTTARQHNVTTSAFQSLTNELVVLASGIEQASLMPADYNARAEQVIVFKVTAWDGNCPKHIPQRFEATDVQQSLADRDRRIAALEREMASLRAVRSAQ